MKPRGPLMIEHRLIEKMLSVFNKEIKKIRESKTVDPVIIDSFSLPQKSTFQKMN